MPFGKRWRARRHDDDTEQTELQLGPEAGELDGTEAGVSIASITPEELALMSEDDVRTVTITTPERAGAVIDGLVPLAANAVQAAQEYGMAVVKFPEGVGWADLCVRHSDGWNLLSSFGPDGKFNAMAGIKQVGLTSVGAANLVLQAGAVAVGMAYMNQINSQLGALQEGVDRVLREMARERDAELKSAFDALRMLADRQEEYLATPEKRMLALQMAERARRDANEAWNYQLAAIRDWGSRLSSEKKALDENKLREKISELAPLEARAAAAYKLMTMSQRLSMGIDSDYTTKRIESERRLAKRLEDEYEAAIGSIEGELLERIGKIGGLPLLVAEAEDDDYEPQHPVLDVAHEAGRQINRLNPFRMAKAAEDDLSRRKTKLQGEMFLANEVARAEESYNTQLDDLDFAFNEADALLIGDGQIRAISMREKEESEEDMPE